MMNIQTHSPASIIGTFQNWFTPKTVYAGSKPHNERPTHFAQLPQISIQQPESLLVEALRFTPGDILTFSVYAKNKRPIKIRISCHQEINGQQYLETEHGKLYFKLHDNTFYCHKLIGRDPHLERLLLALPSLPLSTTYRKKWFHTLPLEFLPSNWYTLPQKMNAYLNPREGPLKISMRWINIQTAQGLIESNELEEPIRTQINFQPDMGINVIHVGDCKFVRVC